MSDECLQMMLTLTRLSIDHISIESRYTKLTIESIGVVLTV